ncbi:MULTISPECIES: hypothetical protein [unclassified Curtobacterium]|uniref:hypothetical protein n=1 Tax=unclassified Curtobacterium TaxID=257496 RepID=UPI000DAA0B8D|nr:MULTISPECIES: hypothetical protein [unclassified Curtobacterium]PZE23545.1 hypothetical protein DEI86_14190 [Curtobacterium sp. MCBD17_028]PZE73483.1 hypothetical protein DEI82_14135 [Curtobacterium sp. MCBD17_019]
MSIVLAQNLFGIALALGAASLLIGLMHQWRRILQRRQTGATQKLRSSPFEAVCVIVGGALVLLALFLSGMAFP